MNFNPNEENDIFNFKVWRTETKKDFPLLTARMKCTGKEQKKYENRMTIYQTFINTTAYCFFFF